MSADPKAVVRRLYDEVWNKRRLDAVAELIAPSHALNDTHLAGSSVGPAAYKAIATEFLSVFPDLRFEVDDLIAEKNKVVASWTISGTHTREFRGVPTTNKKVAIDGVTISHVANGKIIDSYIYLDYLGLLQQLGAVPAELGSNLKQSAPAR
jgi:steroid delta-isomerase-like uncharacterized protein